MPMAGGGNGNREGNPGLGNPSVGVNRGGVNLFVAHNGLRRT